MIKDSSDATITLARSTIDTAPTVNKGLQSRKDEERFFLLANSIRRSQTLSNPQYWTRHDPETASCGNWYSGKALPEGCRALKPASKLSIFNWVTDELEGICDGVWEKMPYPSSILVEEVLKGHSHQDVDNRWVRFLQDLKNDYNPTRGELLKEQATTYHKYNMTIIEMLWREDHGLCTSFAVHVAHETKTERVTSYGNDGTHRVA